jgi:membrane protein involved in colicin uptake
MSQEQFEKKVRPAFTRAAASLNLLQLNWRDTQGRWYATVRTQDQKQVRPALSAEKRAAAIAKAKATKAANKRKAEQEKAAAEATAKAAEQQRPQPVTPGQRRAAS